MLPQALTLPQQPPEVVPKQRLIQLEKNKDSKTFEEKFRNFSYNFFQTKEEAIKALEEIKVEND